jgi:DNA-binding CsgD family transcriptional regulator
VALTHAVVGELDEAETAYQQYVDVLADFYPMVGVRLLVVGAALAYMRGDGAEARRRIARGHAIAPPGVLAEPAVLDMIAALLDAQQDLPVDLAGAEAAVHASLRTLTACGSHFDRLDALETLGVLTAKRGHQLEAARIWGARDSEARRHDVVATLIHRVVAADRAAILAHGDATAVADALAAGAALDIDQLLAYIARARGERKRPSTGWDSLTPTELDVAIRAATGLSNREVGERMFISAGTVKTHLAHVYAKLNVANRTELTVALARRGS